jgi:hypothetical protein
MTILAFPRGHSVDNAPAVNGLSKMVQVVAMAVRIRQRTDEFTSKRMMYARPAGNPSPNNHTSHADYLDPGAV